MWSVTPLQGLYIKMKELDENILVRFLSGQCSDKELAEVREWMAASDDNARELFRLERLYTEVYSGAMPEREVEKALAGVYRRVESRHARLVDMARLMRYAAAVFILVVTGTCIWYLGGGMKMLDRTEYVYAKAAAGQPRQVALADGTMVWLNAGSSLKYPVSFDGGTREVELQGEGYFEVAKNEEKPFVVVSDMVDVKVHGTVFDFKNDRERQVAEVSLIKGSVEVCEHKTKGHVMLVPGQKASIDCATGQVTVRNVDARLDAVWHNRLIPFDNADMRQIANTLEQLYGVDIVVDPRIDRNRTYSGQILHKNNIDTVLNLLRNTLPVEYRRKEGKIYFLPQG